MNELYQKKDLSQRIEIEEKFKELNEIEFLIKKYNSFVVFELYQHFAKKSKLVSLAECGTFLGFDLYKHIQENEYQKRLSSANFCRDRFCEMCNWRRARKYAIENFKLLKYIQQQQKVRYIFATFTIKNPLVSELKFYIKLFNQAWKRMTQSKRWRNSVLGYIKAIEMPFQKTDKNYVNLHAHCLLIVSTSYFNKNCDLYITQREFQEMWKKALRVDYNPSVDVRIIKPNKNRDETDEIASVVAETTKYPLKSIDLYKIDWKVFKELTGQVKNLRFISYGGIVKQYRTALFGTDEFDDKDLVTGYDELDLSVWEKIGRLWYGLDAGKYKLYSFEQGEKNDK
jgi:plasmid rolling circle replication initiator protein Rep